MIVHSTLLFMLPPRLANLCLEDFTPSFSPLIEIHASLTTWGQRRQQPTRGRTSFITRKIIQTFSRFSKQETFPTHLSSKTIPENIEATIILVLLTHLDRIFWKLICDGNQVNKLHTFKTCDKMETKTKWFSNMSSQCRIFARIMTISCVLSDFWVDTANMYVYIHIYI